MTDPLIDIEKGVEKIESLVKNLREDRDKARAEASALKSALDDRELELLQIDEEIQEERRRFDEKLAESAKAKEDLERRLEEEASRIRNIFPLVSEYQTDRDPPAAGQDF